MEILRTLCTTSKLVLCLRLVLKARRIHEWWWFSKDTFLFYLNVQLLKLKVVVRICPSSKHNKDEGIKRKAKDDHIVIIFFLLRLSIPLLTFTELHITCEQNFKFRMPLLEYFCAFSLLSSSASHHSSQSGKLKQSMTFCTDQERILEWPVISSTCGSYPHSVQGDRRQRKNVSKRKK